MGWLLLAALAMIWAAFLLPTWRGSAHRSVRDFERGMELLAGTEEHGQGRWIVTPRKGIPFLGSRARARARARERRRRVFVFLVESIGLSFLIGLVPPLRVMWYGTGVLLALLGAYVWLLVSIRHRYRESRVARAREVAPPERPRPARRRYAADAGGRTARPAFNGLPTFGAEDIGTIVVRPAGRRVGVARV
jgi:hypothetical protein